MNIHSILTLGFGSFGTVNGLPTLGFTPGAGGGGFKAAWATGSNIIIGGVF